MLFRRQERLLTREELWRVLEMVMRIDARVGKIYEVVVGEDDDEDERS